ncbi:protein-L-isoaspartate(D-aspartate) O-methyltransferase [Puniceicoccales bacterium CK1056]|uniref:Protein-L-isoaspartate O-methyltransferase n=1 Tax=Oceanipulchritudo coccoides TaxID=2706888 RepID=A0A6B2M3X7_9BACT|nr:protein-L-isoaspartate(D-aspartate) O-methyltransferase [Oceanipulchritudo coccoides]NDV63463.1 protein-L-isoaspartate(D-aspartate) O-methyltransferase [Oceanipulchritudo coccoides]
MKNDLETPLDSGEHRALRDQMIEQQLRPRGIEDEAVLEAMARVPRQLFVPVELRAMAYADGPLPIGEDQTISQPYIVAVMSEALQLKPGQRVLEIGTGCGYQTAVLAEMGLKVYTIEVLPGLADEAKSRLRSIGYGDVEFRTGNGRHGWLEEAPFDGIIVTAAPVAVPNVFLDQLAPEGRLVIPVGRWSQELRVYRKDRDGCIERQSLFPVRFVPLVKTP